MEKMMKDLPWAAMAIAILAPGTGPLSLDNLLFGRISH
jgi:hypothetical protein